MDLLDPPVRVGVFALSRRHLAEIGYVRETPRERELSAFEHGNHPYQDGKVADGAFFGADSNPYLEQSMLSVDGAFGADSWSYVVTYTSLKA